MNHVAFYYIDKKRSLTMTIRNATIADLQSLTAVEAECFPPAEAATEEDIKARLKVYPNHFWLLLDGERVVGFIDGMVTDEADLRDEMYEDARLHREGGDWQMIFGLNTVPAYRRQGCAGKLMERMIEAAREEGRRGLVLTCKDRLVPYYSKFGFVSEGVSQSEHGGVVWYQMRLTF